MVELTKLVRSDFDKLLLDYNLGQYKAHKHVWWAFGNTVYFLTTTKGKCILKVHETADLNLVLFINSVMNHLQDHKILIPELMKTKKGKSHNIIYKKVVTIQKHILGLRKFKITNTLVKSVAKNIALMDKALIKIKLTGKYTWNGDHQFNKMDVKAFKITGFDIKKEAKLQYTEIIQIDRRKLRRCVIHSDVGKRNILVKDNKVLAIIDFDDLHEDFLVYEIAAFAMDIYNTKSDINKIRLLVKEYEKYTPLNNEEKKAMYYFIKNRFLGAIYHNSRRKKEHKYEESIIQKSAWKTIKQYKSFCKFSLKDFLEQLK